MKEAVEFVAEGVCGVRKLVELTIGYDFIPNVEAIALMLDGFFFTKFIDWGAVDMIFYILSRLVSKLSSCGLPNKWSAAGSLVDAFKKSL